MRRLISLCCLLFLVFAGVSGAFAEGVSSQGGKKWELSCSTPDECWDKIRETNGPNPEVAVGLNHGFPVFAIVKLLREGFGDKVYINKMDNKTKNADLIQGVPAFYINNTFTKPSEKNSTANVSVVVWSNSLEKDFSAPAFKTKILDMLQEWEEVKGKEMIEWLEKEVVLQQKVQQKNAEAKVK